MGRSVLRPYEIGSRGADESWQEAAAERSSPTPYKT